MDAESLSNIMTVFMKDRLKNRGFEWNVNSNQPSSYINTLNTTLQSLASSLETQFGTAIQNMTDRLPSGIPDQEGDVIDGDAPVIEGVDYTTFKTIADELFSSGIQWSHIVTLLVFASELAFTRGAQKGDTDFVATVTDWLIRYFSSSTALKSWIESHGGWDGVIDYGNDGSDRGSSLISSAGQKVSIFGVLTAALSVTLAGMSYLIAKS